MIHPGRLANSMALASVFFIGQSAVLQSAEEEISFPSEPLKEILKEERKTIRPGVEYIYRETADPIKLYIVALDLNNPAISFKTCLGKDTVVGIEQTSSMAKRNNALVAINGDYWTNHGIPLGLTMVDGDIVIAPKHRATFAVNKSGIPAVDIFTAQWSWETEVFAPDGTLKWIQLLNSDCHQDNISMYSEYYGKESNGNEFDHVTELVLDSKLILQEIRRDQPGVIVPSKGYILTGRGSAADWLAEKFEVGQKVLIKIKTTKSLREIDQAISAGPIILKEGQLVQDPVKLFPEGEEFELKWKRKHYLHRHPRSAIGVSKDKKKVVFLAVDGCQKDSSIGIYQRQIAQLLLEFDCYDGMDLDGGGSTTLVIEGNVMNRPSDKSKADGTGGRERYVCNSLLVLYDEGKSVE
jgi:phosphodiester glycosidase